MSSWISLQGPFVGVEPGLSTTGPPRPESCTVWTIES